MTSVDVLPTSSLLNKAFARLESEGRLLSPILKGPTTRSGRFGFRGELALRFAPKIADEARPPELKVDQVLAAAEEDSPTIQFFAAYLLSFEYIKPLVEALGDAIGPGGKYFLFCNNIDLLKKFRVPYGDITFFVLPIDEAGVYAEILELLYIEKNDLKKLNTAGKQDAIVDKALKFEADYPFLSYEEGLKEMGPVRNPNENRPV